MSDICTPPLNNIRNKLNHTKKSFPNNLKLAHMKSLFKKEDTSVPLVSKIYERITQKQILGNIDKHLSPNLRHDPSQILIKLFQMKGMYEIRLSWRCNYKQITHSNVMTTQSWHGKLKFNKKGGWGSLGAYLGLNNFFCT